MECLNQANLKIELYDSAVPLKELKLVFHVVCRCLNESVGASLHSHVHCGIIHDSQAMGSPCDSIIRKMDKENVVYKYNGKLFKLLISSL
jgi:hypothetical protein